MPGEHDEVDREAIAALHKRDERAAKEQDFATLRSLMDDDAVVMEPGRPPLRGRAELDKSFAKRSAGGSPVVIEDYRPEFEEVEIVGDRAIEWGRIVGRLRTLESGETSELAFNVMRVLKCDAGGTWSIYRTIWNEAPARGRSKDRTDPATA